MEAFFPAVVDSCEQEMHSDQHHGYQEKGGCCNANDPPPGETRVRFADLFQARLLQERDLGIAVVEVNYAVCSGVSDGFISNGGVEVSDFNGGVEFFDFFLGGSSHGLISNGVEFFDFFLTGGSSHSHLVTECWLA